MVLLYSTKVIAQNDTLYFGDYLEVVHKEDAKYYGFVVKHGDQYNVSTYYSNGILHMTGTLSSTDLPMSKHREGWFVFYTHSATKISEGAFKNGVRTGEWRHYYQGSDKLSYTEKLADDQEPNVKTFEEKRTIFNYDSVTQEVKTSGMMIGKRRVGEWKAYYRNSDKVKAVINITSKNEGNFEIYDSTTQEKTGEGNVKHGKVTKYEAIGSNTSDQNITQVEKQLPKSAPVILTVRDTIDKIVGEGVTTDGIKTGLWKYSKKKTGEPIFTCNYDNGFLVGEMTGYYPDGKVRRKEYYTYGCMTKGTCYNRTGREIEYFSSTELAASGSRLANYFERSIHYPERARKKMIGGKVVVRFLVNEDGHISDPYKVSGIGWGCDEEALRVVANMDDWSPGTLEGVPVKMYLTLPIVFKLPEQR